METKSLHDGVDGRQKWKIVMSISFQVRMAFGANSE